MKNIFKTTLLFASLALISCGNKDDDKPKKDKPKEEIQVPKISEVRFSYVDFDLSNNYNDYSEGEDFLNDTQLGTYFFTAKEIVVSYHYDTQGRLTTLKTNDITEGTATTVTAAYSANKITLSNFDDEQGVKELSLNNDGNITDFDIRYNEKQQLLQLGKNQYSWKDDNCTKINLKIYDALTECTLSYTQNLNKNNFFLGLLEIHDVTGYKDYFLKQIFIPRGKGTKNLLQQTTYQQNGLPSDFISKYSYEFNADGTVKTIKEEAITNGRIEGESRISGEYTTQKWNSLQALISRIQNGTEKRYTFRELLKNNEKYVVRISSQTIVQKDKNNKPIHLPVDKVIDYYINYKQQGGEKKISEIKIIRTYNIHQNTTYQLKY